MPLSPKERPKCWIITGVEARKCHFAPTEHATIKPDGQVSARFLIRLLIHPKCGKMINLLGA